MLGWRLLISSILIPLLIGLFVADHHLGGAAPLFFFLCVVLAVRSVYELAVLARARTLEPNLPACTVCSVLVIAAGWAGALFAERAGPVIPSHSLSWIGLAFSVAVLFLLFRAVIRFDGPGRATETVSAEVFVVAYAGLLIAVTAQLRWAGGARLGYVALGALLVATKCGDIGAYTFGRWLGRKKMAPRLSPGKTWAGAVGGLLTSALATWGWFDVAAPAMIAAWKPVGAGSSLVFGTFVGGAGMIGDLAESLIKRDTGQKDSAPLMPGFGGLLDLLDSVLFAGPVALLLWLLVLRRF